MDYIEKPVTNIHLYNGFFDIDIRCITKDEYIDLCKKAILNRIYVLFYIDPLKCGDRYEEIIRFALKIKPQVAQCLIRDVSLSKKITKEMLKEIERSDDGRLRE